MSVIDDDFRHPRPITPPHNPDVEAQRQGWCCYDLPNGRWLAAAPMLGKLLTWSSSARDAYVFEGGAQAAYQVSVLGGCVLTNVPRWNGHTFEWSEGAAA